jgi:hypothetical protein
MSMHTGTKVHLLIVFITRLSWIVCLKLKRSDEKSDWIVWGCHRLIRYELLAAAVCYIEQQSYECAVKQLASDAFLSRSNICLSFRIHPALSGGTGSE